MESDKDSKGGRERGEYVGNPCSSREADEGLTAR